MIRYTPHRNRYFSSPENFFEWAGRGSSDRTLIALTIQRASFFVIRSKFFETDLRTKILYLPIAFPFLDKIIEGHGGFLLPRLERGEIIGVFRQFLSDGIVDELGDRARRLDRFQAQRFMQSRVKIDRSPLRQFGYS